MNGPQHCVAAGPYPAVEELERRLTAQGVEHRRLRTSHAFHSAMLDPVVGPFEEQVARFDLRAPRIPVVSCVTGRVASAEELGAPGYWAGQLRGTVRFADAVRTAAEQGAEVFLEVGPGRTLGSMVRRGGVPAHRVISSARGADDPRTDGEALLEALGALHCAGVPVDWQEFWAGQRRHRVPLPGYPFERQRHWIEPVPAATEPSPQAAVTPAASEPAAATGSLVRHWTPVPRTGLDAAGSQPGDWLVVADDGLGQALADRLEKEGERVVRVRRGAAFAARDTDFVLDPASPRTWPRCSARCAGAEGCPAASCWSADRARPEPLGTNCARPGSGWRSCSPVPGTTRSSSPWWRAGCTGSRPMTTRHRAPRP